MHDGVEPLAMKKLLLVLSVLFATVALGKGVRALLHDGPVPTVTYWGDGTTRNTTEYLDGQKDGRSEQWHANGSKEWDGQYRAGLREGEWLFWNEDGTLDSERSGLYHEGQRVQR